VKLGRTLRIWGMVRPGHRAGRREHVRIWVFGLGTHAWRQVASVTTDAHGYLDGNLRVTGSGAVRLSWRGHFSRAARFAVLR
ncbi:MAG: hypothetical protein ACRENN_01960, partial [Candidatus Eiseniibacteriota bacterium]